MPKSIRMTLQTALVLQALERGYRYGFDIMDGTGLPDGSVYPILRRLHRAGMVTARWEGSERAQQTGRPARRYYDLTAAGLDALALGRQRFPLVVGAIAAREARA